MCSAYIGIYSMCLTPTSKCYHGYPVTECRIYNARTSSCSCVGFNVRNHQIHANCVLKITNSVNAQSRLDHVYWVHLSPFQSEQMIQIFSSPVHTWICLRSRPNTPSKAIVCSSPFTDIYISDRSLSGDYNG